MMSSLKGCGDSAAHPFFKLDDAVYCEAHAEYVETRGGVEWRGVEEAVHDRRVCEEHLRDEPRGEAGEVAPQAREEQRIHQRAAVEEMEASDDDDDDGGALR